jgi:hypothetical protein
MHRLRFLLLLVTFVVLSATACVERTPAPPTATETSSGSAAGTAPARTTPCPDPKPDVVCTKEYNPVLCDGCRYANPCLAGAAGFTSGQCVSERSPEAGKKPCPEPAPDVICTMEYAPVICDGCRYSNGCVAGAAGFKKEQCVPAPSE